MYHIDAGFKYANDNRSIFFAFFKVIASERTRKKQLHRDLNDSILTCKCMLVQQIYAEVVEAWPDSIFVRFPTFVCARFCANTPTLEREFSKLKKRSYYPTHLCVLRNYNARNAPILTCKSCPVRSRGFNEFLFVVSLPFFPTRAIRRRELAGEKVDT